MSRFDAFDLDERILRSIADLGFETATPIQTSAIPPVLAGRDVIGQARTGSGKTAAFGLPLLERLKERGGGVRALVLAPTRELATQVAKALESFSTNLPVRLACVYGGAAYYPQLKALKTADIVVGTPGRVLDHMRRGTLDLSGLQVLVLDEADEMLRMGFIEDVELVLEAAPNDRQIVLFSATMPDPIKRVADRFLVDAEHLHVEGEALTVDHIDQRWMRVPNKHKLEALLRVLKTEERGASLIFARTRAGCAELCDLLNSHGVRADAIHGELNQTSRERVLQRLRSGAIDTVVATDVAARGIDIAHLTHVINVDFPNDPETYVHRIGRTGRAGADGKAITFVTPNQRRKLEFLERTLGERIEQMEVPSDLEIAGAERAELLEDVKKAMSRAAMEDARTWVQLLVPDEGFTVEDLARRRSCLAG